MSKLCPECFYLGKPKKRFLNKWVPYGNFGFGIGFLFFTIYGNEFGRRSSESPLYVFIYSAIAITIAVTVIVYSFIETNTCPKCGHNDMLSLDNPEAINLIKKYDLTVGENPSPSSQNEPSSDSLETLK